MDDTGLCLDTNVLIAFLKGREPGQRPLRKQSKSMITMSLAHADDNTSITNSGSLATKFKRTRAGP